MDSEIHGSRLGPRDGTWTTKQDLEVVSNEIVAEWLHI